MCGAEEENLEQLKERCKEEISKKDGKLKIFWMKQDRKSIGSTWFKKTANIHVKKLIVIVFLMPNGDKYI